MTKTTRGLAADTDSNQHRIESAKAQIAWILTRRKGRDAAIPSTGLAAATGLQPTTVRDLIPQLRRDQRLPVGSSRDGYYLIESEADFLQHMRRYESQRETAREHQQQLAMAWYYDD